MKKIISIILILATMLSLFACVKDGKGNGGDTTTEKPKVTTTVDDTTDGTNNSEDTTTEETTTEETTTKPETTKPQTTKPSTTKPQTTKPQTTKPQTTKPQTTKPQTTKPETTKPQTTAPTTTAPSTTAPPEPEPTKGELVKFNIGIGTPIKGAYRFAAYDVSKDKMCELEPDERASWSPDYPGHHVIFDPTEYVVLKSEDDASDVDLMCSADYGAAVVFTAGESGTATVVVEVTKLQFNDVKLDILLMKGDGTTLDYKKNVSEGRTTVSFEETVDLVKGDTVYLLVKYSKGFTPTGGGQNVALKTFEVYFNEHKVNTSVNKPTVSNADIKSWATHSFDKIILNAPKDTGSTKYTVSMAKAETEGCQLVVMNNDDSSVKTGRLELVSNPYGSIGIEMFTLEYGQNWKGNSYTDACVPYEGGTMSISPKMPLPFLVEFTTSHATPSGDYLFVFAFIGDLDMTVALFEVTVHVWNVSLPLQKNFRTAAGLNIPMAMHFEGTGNDDATYFELYTDYYNFLLEHNLSAYNFIGGILNDYYLSTYLSNPAVTFVQVPCTGEDGNLLPDHEILEYYYKLKQNPKWLKKAVFYPLDEPHTMEHIEKYNEMCAHLRALCPEIPVIAPFYTNIKTGEGTDQVDTMYADSGIWCPKLALWDDSQSYAELDYTPAKTFAQRMEEKLNSDVEIWSYVCNAPNEPYSQLFVNTKGGKQRMLFWQMYQRDVSGFLYWGVNSWREVGTYAPINPWETVDIGLADDKGEAIIGDGVVLYPGKQVGVDGPIASVRLKYIRDGIDDIELMLLAEQYLGEDWVKSKTNGATGSLTTFTDDDSFAKIRKEIGDALSKKFN